MLRQVPHPRAASAWRTNRTASRYSYEAFVDRALGTLGTLGTRGGGLCISLPELVEAVRPAAVRFPATAGFQARLHAWAMEQLELPEQFEPTETGDARASTTSQLLLQLLQAYLVPLCTAEQVGTPDCSPVLQAATRCTQAATPCIQAAAPWS